MRQATGVIMVAQEGRFRLACDNGRSQLFVLDRHASLEAQDLHELARCAAHVEVRFSQASGVSAALAHDLHRIAVPA